MNDFKNTDVSNEDFSPRFSVSIPRSHAIIINRYLASKGMRGAATRALFKALAEGLESNPDKMLLGIAQGDLWLGTESDKPK